MQRMERPWWLSFPFGVQEIPQDLTINSFFLLNYSVLFLFATKVYISALPVTDHLHVCWELCGT